MKHSEHLDNIHPTCEDCQNNLILIKKFFDYLEIPCEILFRSMIDVDGMILYSILTDPDKFKELISKINNKILW